MSDIKRTNVFGTPIYKTGNDKCPYFHYERSKFSMCIVPCRDYYRKKHTLGSVVSCDPEYTNCPLYLEQNIPDIKMIGNYIEKYSEDGWIIVSDKHWEILRDQKISVHQDDYLTSLFEYYGYYCIEDEHVEGKPFTNYKKSEVA